VFAGELNPVAYVILAATLDYPARFGEDLVSDIQRFGKYGQSECSSVLRPTSQCNPTSRSFAYLWARTVACPYTGKPVPLSPNWWLRSKDEPVVAVRLIADEDADVCRFEIVRGRAARAARPERGTVAGGEGISPWTGDPIPEDYIKAEAQAGRMGAQLYAVAIQTAQGKKDFRLPTEEDLDAVRQAEEELARRLPGWEAKGLVPREERFPTGSNDERAANGTACAPGPTCSPPASSWHCARTWKPTTKWQPRCVPPCPRSGPGRC
jgi:putative DNA methylase